MGAGAIAPVVQSMYGHIGDVYQNPEQVTQAIRDAGMYESQLIFAVDFSKSNIAAGTITNEGMSLHRINKKAKGLKDRNPYEQCFSYIAETMSVFDEDQLFPVYGFADAHCGDRTVFSFLPNDKPIHGLEATCKRYKEVCQCTTLGGPTSLAPIIRQAIKKIREAAAYAKPQFHVLLICMDGQVSQMCKLETEFAIQEASHYPMSIVAVGVGDGPWDSMEKYDDRPSGICKNRCFDNFQFVNFNEVFNNYPYIKRKEAFVLHCLQQVPKQYKACRMLGYLSNNWEMPRKFKQPHAVLNPPDYQTMTDPSYGVVDGWTAVWHSKLKTYFYMSKTTGETLWDKPCLTIYKPEDEEVLPKGMKPEDRERIKFEDDRKQELQAMDSSKLQKLCAKMGVDPYVKEIMVERVSKKRE